MKTRGALELKIRLAILFSVILSTSILLAEEQIISGDDNTVINKNSGQINIVQIQAPINNEMAINEQSRLLSNYLIGAGFERNEIINYLGMVVEEAKSLSIIWGEVTKNILAELDKANTGRNFDDIKSKISIDDKKTNANFIVSLRMNKEPNAPFFYKLGSFHFAITDVLEDVSSKKRYKNFIEHLGKLVYKRKLTHENYLRVVSNISENGSHYRWGLINDLEVLSGSVTTLKAEAARLEAILETIKVLEKGS